MYLHSYSSLDDSSHVLNWLFREQLFDLLVNSKKLERRLDQSIEKESEVHQQSETHNLEPLECLPTKSQRHHPDEQSSASVDGGSRGCTDGSGDGEPEEVETTNTVSVCAQ